MSDAPTKPIGFRLLALANELAAEWEAERLRARAESGGAFDLEATDADALRDLLLEIEGALIGTNGWDGVRRAHAALVEADRTDRDRRVRALRACKWALRTRYMARQKMDGETTQELESHKATLGRHDRQVAELLISSLKEEDPAFGALDVGRVRDMLAPRLRANADAFKLLADLIVHCNAFGNANEEALRKSLEAHLKESTNLED